MPNPGKMLILFNKVDNFIVYLLIPVIILALLIGIYNPTIQALEIASLALLLLVIGGIRTLALRYSPADGFEAHLYGKP